MCMHVYACLCTNACGGKGQPQVLFLRYFCYPLSPLFEAESMSLTVLGLIDSVDQLSSEFQRSICLCFLGLPLQHVPTYLDFFFD